MILKLMTILSLLGCAASAGAASDARQPGGQWVVDFDDASCVATRTYGTADAPLHFVLKAPPLGDVMQIAVIRAGDSFGAKQVEAKLEIDGRLSKTNMLMFSPPKEKTRVYLLNMPTAEFAAVREAKNLTIRAQGLSETFALSQMEPLLKVMNDCVADLRQVWNVGLSETAPSNRLGQRATANLASLFSPDDYPTSALEGDEGGTVRVAILINERGRVADCTVTQTSGVAVLDVQACRIITERAKFTPARGVDGKPAKDAAVQRIRWVMPDF